MNSNNAVAIITARGGSKRIPGKNIKEFCGKPIISYSIRAAFDSGVFSEVMVSTDSEEIASVAQEYGAQVPFFRSRETADDYATTSDVLLEVIEEYEKRDRFFQYGCCIYPTAPFVTGEKLSDTMRKLMEGETDAVMPVVPFSYPPQRGMVLQEGKLVLKWPEHMDARSQDLQTIYHDCGQFYGFRIDSLKRNKKVLTGNIIPVIVPELEVQDIDTLEDWTLAELKYAFCMEKAARR